MNIRTLLPGAAMAAVALVPAAALANLQVNTTGFNRVVTESTRGDSCRVPGPIGAKMVRCPDGSAGTMTLYRHSHESPVCEVDFWYAGNGSGVERWRAQLSHPNADLGTCSLHWVNGATLDLNVQ